MCSLPLWILPLRKKSGQRQQDPGENIAPYRLSLAALRLRLFSMLFPVGRAVVLDPDGRPYVMGAPEASAPTGAQRNMSRSRTHWTRQKTTNFYVHALVVVLRSQKFSCCRRARLSANERWQKEHVAAPTFGLPVSGRACGTNKARCRSRASFNFKGMSQMSHVIVVPSCASATMDRDKCPRSAGTKV